MDTAYISFKFPSDQKPNRLEILCRWKVYEEPLAYINRFPYNSDSGMKEIIRDTAYIN